MARLAQGVGSIRLASLVPSSETPNGKAQPAAAPELAWLPRTVVRWQTAADRGRLPDFFATLQVRAGDDEERYQRAERERKEREEQERRARIQKARAERLDHEIAEWEKADRIRCYSERLRNRLKDLPSEEQQRLGDWCEWAEQRADQLDRTVNVRLVIGIDDERDRYGWSATWPHLW
jgi:hypothetical protein